MKKSKIIKTLQQKEDKILNSLEEFVDFLDATEDPSLSEMGHELVDMIVDILHCHDTYSINEIRAIVEEEFE